MSRLSKIIAAGGPRGNVEAVRQVGEQARDIRANAARVRRQDDPWKRGSRRPRLRHQPFYAVNANQWTFTKFMPEPVTNFRYTVWTPDTVDMFAGTVRQLCQPPVFAIAKLLIAGFDRLSRWTSTRPLAPPPTPDATRAWNWVAEEPKLTLLY